MKFFKSLLRLIINLPIYLYKVFISPLLPHCCRFYPTCSSYFIQVVNQFGVFKGSFLGVKRLCRCNPKNRNCGYDPIPINIKGETKWLF